MAAVFAVPDYAWKRGIEWRNVWLLLTVHVLGVVGFWYACIEPTYLRSNTMTLAVTLFFFCHLSIRCGVHSLYTHQAYKAAWIVHVVFLLLQAATFQGPALYWAYQHIRHHASVDTEDDPYAITSGFFFAHCLWTFFKDPPIDYAKGVKWLRFGSTVQEKRIVRLIFLQAKYWWLVGVTVGLLLPTLIAGLLWGDWLGGLLIGGFLRLVFQYHCTWQVNSVSHSVGPQPYGTNDSSRNSPWFLVIVTAILSVGESVGHNRHHHFANDYRIGHKWWHLDPGKWFIRLLWLCGLTWDLHVFKDDGHLTRVPLLWAHSS